MTQSPFLDWLGTSYGLGWRVRKLDAAVKQNQESAYYGQVLVQRDLAEVRGTLEQRMDRLARTLDAFIQLSDVRAELAVFEDETRVRHATQRLLRGMLRRSTDPSSAPSAGLPALPADLPRCPGYWLRPAVAWLSAALGGDQRDQAGAWAEAQQLDPVRTAAFLAVGLGLAGQGQRAYPLLAAALQQPREQVTYTQRAMWQACAHGAYGDKGRDLIGQWLTGHVRGLDASSARAEMTQWVTASKSLFDAPATPVQLSYGLSWELPGTEALTAAQKLSRLNSLVHEAAAGEPAVAGTWGSSAGPGPDTAADSPVAALAAVAAALTEEGSEEEITLRQHARQLRDLIDGHDTPTKPSWDAAEDATLTLLRKDAFGASVPLRRVALISCGHWVRGLAAQLAETARTPPPGQFPITVDGRIIHVSASGEIFLDAAYTEIENEVEAQNASAKLFRGKQIAAEVSSRQEQLARDVGKAEETVRQRLSEMRAAAGQAETCENAIAADLIAMP